jgi:hypothetical protein
VTGGVAGLVLPGSGDPAGLYPIGTAGVARYFIYKAFLAVSPSAAPFATVSVTRPPPAPCVVTASAHDRRPLPAGTEADKPRSTPPVRTLQGIA